MAVRTRLVLIRLKNVIQAKILEGFEYLRGKPRRQPATNTTRPHIIHVVTGTYCIPVVNNEHYPAMTHIRPAPLFTCRSDHCSTPWRQSTITRQDQRRGHEQQSRCPILPPPPCKDTVTLIHVCILYAKELHILQPRKQSLELPVRFLLGVWGTTRPTKIEPALPISLIGVKVEPDEVLQQR